MLFMAACLVFLHTPGNKPSFAKYSLGPFKNSLRRKFTSVKIIICSAAPVATNGQENFLDQNFLCPVWSVCNYKDWYNQSKSGALLLLQEGLCIWVIVCLVIACCSLGWNYFFRVSQVKSKLLVTKKIYINILCIVTSVLMNLPFNFPSYFPETGCFFLNFLYSEYSPFLPYAEHIIVFIKTYSVALAGGIVGRHMVFFWKNWGRSVLFNLLRKFGWSEYWLRGTWLVDLRVFSKQWIQKSNGKKNKTSLKEKPVEPIGSTTENEPEIFWPTLTRIWFLYPLFVAWVVTLSKVPAPIFLLAGTIFFCFIYLHTSSLWLYHKELSAFFDHLKDVRNSKIFNEKNKIQQNFLCLRGWQCWYVGSISKHPWFIPVYLTLFAGFCLVFIPSAVNTVMQPKQNPMDWHFLTETYEGQVIGLLGGALSLFFSAMLSLLVITKEWVPSSFYSVYDRGKVYQLLGNPSSGLADKMIKIGLGATIIGGGGVYMYNHQRQMNRELYERHAHRVESWNKRMPLERQIPPITENEFHQGTRGNKETPGLPVNPLIKGPINITPDFHLPSYRPVHNHGLLDVSNQGLPDHVSAQISGGKMKLQEPGTPSQPVETNIK